MRKSMLRVVSLALCLGLLLAPGALAQDRPFADSIYAEAPTPQNKAKVILDCDMGVMLDDAKCLVMLINSGAVDVLGITLEAGNTYVEEGMATALRQLELFGHPEIPVYAGPGEPLMGNRFANVESDIPLWGHPGYLAAYEGERPASYLELPEEPLIGYPTIAPAEGNAVDFIAETVKANPGEVTLLATGPLTNVALAVVVYPEIVPLVKQIIYMGGAFDVPGNTTPAAEMNWFMDPEAAKIALNTPFARQLIVPLDACNRAFITRDFYERVAAAEPKTAVTELYAVVEGEDDYKWSTFDGRAPVWDELTVAMLLKPELATRVETRYVDVDVYPGLNCGRSMGYVPEEMDAYGKPVNAPANAQPCEILMDLDVEGLWDFMYERLVKDPNPAN